MCHECYSNVLGCQVVREQMCDFDETRDELSYCRCSETVTQNVTNIQITINHVHVHTLLVVVPVCTCMSGIYFVKYLLYIQWGVYTTVYYSRECYKIAEWCIYLK